MNLRKGDLFGLVVVFIMLVGLAVFFTYAPRSEAPTTTQAVVDGSALESEKTVDENSVAVVATTKTTSFVTIHELFGGGAPGAIIGISDPIAPGDHRSVVIHVTKPFDPNADYIALMVKDDGDGVYEPNIDLPIVSHGTVVKSTFGVGDSAP